MALLPSIMSLFGNKPAAAQPVTNPADPLAAASQAQLAGTNTTVPSQATPKSTGTLPAVPVAGQGDASPLANFADLWKTDANQNQVTPSLVPNFNLDPKGLMDAAKKVSFTSHIAPEQVAKAMSGDAAAFLDVMNQVAQFGFANATAASGELIKNSLGTAQGILTDTVLPSALRNQDISRAMNEANPIFSDPAVAPMLGMLKNQLAQKYPTSSPQEIASMAASYLSGVSEKIVTSSGGQVISKASGNQNQSFRSPEETDWTTFFGA